MRKILFILRGLYRYYSEKHIPRAAAALSYYLTMTFFPLIICLYSLLGRSYTHVMEAIDFISQFISAKTTEMLRSFIRYVAQSNNRGMFWAGVLVLVTSASAAERSLQMTIGEMQGKQRFKALGDFLFSVVFSLAFVGAIYFAIVVLFTGRELIGRLNTLLPFVDIGGSWQWIRFVLLAGICMVLFWAIYWVTQPRAERYPCFAGALFSTLAVEGMSLLFSNFISASARYPLVYGSLASLILLMFWLYLNCQIIYLGAALNLTLRDMRERKS